MFSLSHFGFFGRNPAPATTIIPAQQEPSTTSSGFQDPALWDDCDFRNEREEPTRWPKALILTSNDGTQTGRSGYDVLADYIPNARTVTVPRWSPHGFGQRLRCKLISLGAASRWHLLSSHELERQAEVLLRSEPFDLVHMLWGDRDWGRIDRICQCFNVPLIVTSHACPDDLPAILNRRRRLLSPSAFVLMSTHQRSFFLENGVPAKRLHVIHHGIDIEHFKPKQSRTDEVRILTVGAYRRNFDLLEAVMRRLQSDRHARFIIISQEGYRGRFAQLPNVEFLSHVSNEKLRQEYQRASIFVMSAHDATANNAMVEALACGLPIVCERIGGLPEYATETCAIHTTPGSAEEMADALRRLSLDPSLRHRMGQAARIQAESLSWQNSARKLLQLYRNVCSSS